MSGFQRLITSTVGFGLATVLAATGAGASVTIGSGTGTPTTESFVTTAAQEPDLAGVVLADRLQPFTINGDAGGIATGNIQERVVRSNDTGFLHFYHRVTFDSISGFDPGSYIEWLDLDAAATGNPLAVGSRSDGLGSPTSSTVLFGGSGESAFDFNLIDLDPANNGFSTRFHYFKTDATNYALTGQTRLRGFEFLGFNANGVNSGWLPTWAPSSGIPEPQSWAMLIAGFGLAGAVLRRGKRTGRRQAAC